MTELYGGHAGATVWDEDVARHTLLMAHGGVEQCRTQASPPLTFSPLLPYSDMGNRAITGPIRVNETYRNPIVYTDGDQTHLVRARRPEDSQDPVQRRLQGSPWIHYVATSGP
ncbi:hypothetical protein B296_00036398 [Ensete ventricosum]|uniref:Uncharacterized protein n=1 Tax=Ensete ventricosum TaxID=4639 RepID=A0A426ZUI4_ENSVE|nr:hypothetical protein B296_00036398 [Ensete ventricosum]